MRLFGRDLSRGKKLPTEAGEFTEQNYDIISFFHDAMQRAGVDSYFSTLVLGTAGECLQSGSLCLNGITKAMPLALCILRKAGFRAVGTVDPIAVSDVKDFIVNTCGASAKSANGLDCWNLTIGHADYSFYLMTGAQPSDIRGIPREIIVITDKSPAELVGVDRQVEVVRDSFI